MKLPEGKVRIPGVIECQSNCIEHPEVVWAKLASLAQGAALASRQFWP